MSYSESTIDSFSAYSNYKWIIWLYKAVEEFGSTSVFSLHLYEIGPAN